MHRSLAQQKHDHHGISSTRNYPKKRTMTVKKNSTVGSKYLE